MVTRVYSDWSIAPLDPSFTGKNFTIKLHREGEAYTVHYRIKVEDPWTLLRMAYLESKDDVHAGVMVCAPSGPGFKAQFSDYSVTCG